MKNVKYITTVLVALVLTTSIIIAGGHKNEETKSKKNIIETALSAGTFKTLATALTEADLVDALQGEGPFTVFAPTDEAFSKLPEGTVESLLKDKKALKEVLLYHVVSGKVTSTDVVKLNKAETLSGSNIKIKVKDGGVKINNSAVTAADVYASNGVIHVIDTVLLPPKK